MGGRYSRRDVVAISGAVVLGGAAVTSLAPGRTFGQEATPTPDLLRAPEADPQRGGMVRTAWGATTAHYDLHQGASSAVLANVYDLLVMKNLADGLRTIIPGLATSWEIADDGLTYTFTLREGVTFHDGTPFSADDVAATFNRIIFPPEGMVSVYRSELGPVER
ncbi:MAG: ABC transporter substrate-binding protein, partial [Chloroflexota bacterium]|nr:ABC transporter substrate-binding protein [Chloroflexota bacterium]